MAIVGGLVGGLTGAIAVGVVGGCVVLLVDGFADGLSRGLPGAFARGFNGWFPGGLAGGLAALPSGAAVALGVSALGLVLREPLMLLALRDEAFHWQRFYDCRDDPVHHRRWLELL